MAALDDRHGGKVAYTTLAAAMPEGGHGRGTSSERRDPEPRCPIIGVNAGAIPGSQPGGEVGSKGRFERQARALNEHGRLVARQRMQEARERLKRGARA